MVTTAKLCKRCGETQELSSFYPSKTTKDGHQYHCKSCCSAVASAYLKGKPEVWMLTNIKRRAEQKGLPFNLTKEDLVAPANCPVLGIPIRHNKRQGPDSITVDRIIPELGYVKGNILLVSDLANRIKTNATPDQIRKVADFYDKLHTITSSTTDPTQNLQPTHGRHRQEL